MRNGPPARHMEPSPNEITPGATRPLRVIIIGGGFSGTLVAVHLLRQNRSVQIDLIDQSLPGRGLAYSTSYDEHLLNVPAVRMSAFGSEPMHFLDWLHAHGLPLADPGLFAPRKLYGTYLQDVLQATARSAGPNSQLRHHVTEAVRISFNGLSATVFLQNGESLGADKVVLALGNPASQGVAESLPGYFSSPWQSGALSGMRAEKDILLVGAGLTAVDAFLALVSQGHTGKIYMVSRRGKIPQTHAPYRPLPDPFPSPETVSARGLLNTIRSRVRRAQTQGVDWRAVIDSIRPVTNDIWQQLTLKEQLRFFRHLKLWWDIHRHRMAPQIGAKVQDSLERGQLSVQAGRLQRLHAAESGLQAEVLLRTGSRTFLNVERIVNCTGPDDDYRRTDNILVRHLLQTGYVVPGSLGKGLQTTEQGELIASDGKPTEWLIALGPIRIGDLLETIAVPELRKQAEAIANRLLSIAREPVEVRPELFIAAGI